MVAGSTSATVSTSKVKLMVPVRPSSDSGREGVGVGLRVRRRRAALLGGLEDLLGLGLGRGDRVGQRARPAAICGRSPRSATRVSTAFELAGSESVVPFGAWTTTVTEAWSRASAEPGNSSDWRSAAFSDGMPGMVNASLMGLEKPAAMVMTAMSSTSQPAMKNGQRR